MLPVTAAAVPAVVTPRLTTSSRPSLMLNLRSVSTMDWKSGCAWWILGMSGWIAATCCSCAETSSAVPATDGFVVTASSGLITAVPASVRPDCLRYWTDVVASLTAVVGSTGNSQRWSYPNATPSRLSGFRSVNTVPPDHTTARNSSQLASATRFSKNPRWSYRSASEWNTGASDRSSTRRLPAAGFVLDSSSCCSGVDT